MRVVVGSGLLRREGMLLNEEFDVAGLTSPRDCDPGPGQWIVFNVGGLLSIGSGKLTSAGGGSLGDHAVYSVQPFERRAGLAFILSYGESDTRSARFGFDSDQSGSDFLANSALRVINVSIRLNNGAGTLIHTAFTRLIQNEMAVVLRSDGAHFFEKISGTWEYLFNTVAGNNSPVYPALAFFDAIGSYAFGRLKYMISAWETDTLESLNQVSPVVSTNYTAQADGLFEIAIATPNPLADELRFFYRYQDASNYWEILANSAGDLQLNSIAGGVSTNRITAAGVLAANSTYTLRVRVKGTRHNLYSIDNTGAVAKHGTEVNVATAFDAATLVRYTTTSYTASLIKSWARTAAIYADLDVIL